MGFGESQKTQDATASLLTELARKQWCTDVGFMSSQYQATSVKELLIAKLDFLWEHTKLQDGIALTWENMIMIMIMENGSKI